MAETLPTLTEEALRVRSAALDMIPQGVILAAKDGHIQYANDAFLCITGYARSAILGRHCSLFQGPRTDPATVAAIRHALAAGVAFSGDILLYRQNGNAYWSEMTITPVRNDHGVLTHFIGTTQDVTSRIHAEHAVRESEQRLQLALLGGDLALWDWRVQDGLLTVNQRWLAMLGLDPHGEPPTIELWTNRVHPADRIKLDRIVEHVVLHPEGRDFEIELRARHSNGTYIWILDKGAVVERAADGTPLRVSGTHLDITARKEADRKMHRLAYHDALTGLPNRRLLLDRLALALTAAQRATHMGALLFIDLDNFKQINDARGHLVGDMLLQQVARRLTSCVAPDHMLARLGGDEFVVLAGAMHGDIDTSKHGALRLAENMHKALAAPFTVGDVKYRIGGSIGVTLFPKPGDEVGDLIREADTAMYCAKAKRGDAHIAFFETAMYVAAQRQLSMEHDLRKAVADCALDLHVESKIRCGGQEVGGELLLRWTHPVHGSVLPTQFIPVAEATGQIIPLGNWVIDQACQALVQLQAAGCHHTLSVNVSPRQFLQEDFTEQVHDAVRRTGAPARSLIFEVTEGLFIENWEATVASMVQLAALGIRFSIDDFGTGYSSLAYLTRLPLHELKIDRSFLQNIPEDAGNKAIVHAILSVARHLQLHVVAEGVETRAQADFLASVECESMQGYLFGRPMPLHAWLARARGMANRHV